MAIRYKTSELLVLAEQKESSQNAFPQLIESMIFFGGKQAKTDSNLSKECQYIAPWSMQIESFHGISIGFL